MAVEANKTGYLISAAIIVVVVLGLSYLNNQLLKTMDRVPEMPVAQEKSAPVVVETTSSDDGPQGIPQIDPLNDPLAPIVPLPDKTKPARQKATPADESEQQRSYEFPTDKTILPQ